MIRLNEVTKIFDKDLFKKKQIVLDKMSYGIKENSITGFLGANGAGKTTSIKIILDFIRPNSGSVDFQKPLGTNLREAILNIGLLPERPYFYANITAREFLNYLGRLSLMSNNDVKCRIEDLAAKLCIGFALDRKIKFFSKGMLQRLGFVSAILHRPKLVILDEPAAGLDPLGRREMKDHIIDLKSEGITVFFSTHIVSDVEDICDRVVFIKNGICEYDGELINLLEEKSQKKMILKYSAGGIKASLEVDTDHLNEKLSDLMRNHNVKIESINPMFKTLEDAIYTNDLIVKD